MFPERTLGKMMQNYGYCCTFQQRIELLSIYNATAISIYNVIKTVLSSGVYSDCFYYVPTLP